MNDLQLIEKAKEYLNTGDTQGLSGLIFDHPKLLDYRSHETEHFTLLHQAARDGDLNQAEMLLEVGADPADRTGEWIVDEVPEEGYYEPGWTALMLAARGGHVEVVRLLIGHGVSVDDVDHYGGSAVHSAAAANAVEIVDLLLTKGAAMTPECHVSQFDETLGWHFVGTPMHVAADCGCAEIIKCLLRHGTPVDQRLFPCKRTPLHFAAARGHLEAVEALVEAGADPNLRESRSDHGIDNDFTPLHYAAREEHVDVVKRLLDAGADRDVLVTRTSQTAAQLAEEEGYIEVARLLQERGPMKNQCHGHVQNIFESIAKIQGNLGYIDQELPGLKVPQEIEEAVSSVTQSIGNGVLDIRAMAQDFANNFIMPQNENLGASNPQACDPNKTKEMIMSRMSDEMHSLNAIVQRLISLSKDNPSKYGVVSVLVGESATNILNAFVCICDTFDSITKMINAPKETE